MSLTVKIMTETSPLHGSYDDASPLATHDIVAGVTRVTFGRAEAVQDHRCAAKSGGPDRPFVEMDGERTYTNGNVYVMNEAGRTISKFAGHVLYAPEELQRQSTANQAN